MNGFMFRSFKIAANPHSLLLRFIRIKATPSGYDRKVFAKRLAERIDTNKDGKIDYGELSEAIDRELNVGFLINVKFEDFTKLAKDSKAATLAEVEEYLKSFDFGNEEEIKKWKEIFDKMDTDKDGFVSFEEWKKYSGGGMGFEIFFAGMVNIDQPDDLYDGRTYKATFEQFIEYQRYTAFLRSFVLQYRLRDYF